MTPKDFVLVYQTLRTRTLPAGGASYAEANRYLNLNGVLEEALLVEHAEEAFERERERASIERAPTLRRGGRRRSGRRARRARGRPRQRRSRAARECGEGLALRRARCRLALRVRAALHVHKRVRLVVAEDRAVPFERHRRALRHLRSQRAIDAVGRAELLIKYALRESAAGPLERRVDNIMKTNDVGEANMIYYRQEERVCNGKNKLLPRYPRLQLEFFERMYSLHYAQNVPLQGLR